jgi:hypothetical protein
MDGVLRAFNGWMNGGGAWELIALPVVVFFAILVHELGHAAVGLATTDGLVRVRVGREPPAFTARLGRLVMSLDPRPSRGRTEGSAAMAGPFTPAARAACVLAGPLAEGAFATALVLVGRPLFGTLIACSAAWNLVPRHVGSLKSDGRHALEALRGQMPAPTPLQETTARAQAAFCVAQNLVQRRPLLEAGDAALTQTAFYGWCWRDAQREDLGAAPQLAPEALRRARAAGASEDGLTKRAALELAASSATFGALFAAGFETLSFAGPVDERHRRAFRYGGALREIERILQ